MESAKLRGQFTLVLITFNERVQIITCRRIVFQENVGEQLTLVLNTFNERVYVHIITYNRHRKLAHICTHLMFTSVRVSCYCWERNVNEIVLHTLSLNVPLYVWLALLWNSWEWWLITFVPIDMCLCELWVFKVILTRIMAACLIDEKHKNTTYKTHYIEFDVSSRPVLLMTNTRIPRTKHTT